MPLIENFKATTIWKAFTLNSLVASITIVIALVLKSKFDKLYGQDDCRGIIFTFILTFSISFLSFVCMHYVFGYGSGQLALTGTK